MTAMRLASKALRISSEGRMANGHRSFHYFSGRMNGSPSNIFKNIGFGQARDMYNNEIRHLIEPRWGRQDTHAYSESETTRTFMAGFCAALDFVPLLGNVDRWSAEYVPGQVEIGELPDYYLNPKPRRGLPAGLIGITFPPRPIEATIFNVTKLVAKNLPTVCSSCDKDPAYDSPTYPRSIYQSLTSLLGPFYRSSTGQMDWRQDHSNRSYPENTMSENLFFFFSRLLQTLRPGMAFDTEYECYKGWDQSDYAHQPRLRGVADLAICMGSLGESGFQSERHAITGLVGELKSDASIKSACAAFVQVMQYMTTDTVIDNMQAVADKVPGLTPWTVAMIGTGVANFQMFAISLPVLKRIRRHLDEYSMPESKLPVLVLSSASSLPVLPPNQVLISDADPFMGPKQLVDFVQLASWIGSPVSQWAGVGGAACEAKVRRVLDEGSAM